jgi:hypothetical protein
MHAKAPLTLPREGAGCASASNLVGRLPAPPTQGDLAPDGPQVVEALSGATSWPSVTARAARSAVRGSWTPSSSEGSSSCAAVTGEPAMPGRAGRGARLDAAPGPAAQWRLEAGGPRPDDQVPFDGSRPSAPASSCTST